MKFNLIPLLITAILALPTLVAAQDVNFSQFNVMSSYYNPAATGSFDGNFKVRVIHRNQWANFASSPYKSFALSGDIKFDLRKQNFEKDFIAVGVYFLTDKAQALDWNKNEMGVNLAFQKRLNKIKRTYLSTGVGVGVLQRSLSYDNIYFQDQFNGLDEYDGSTNEILPQNIHNSGDLKLGIQIASILSKKWNIQTGIGIHYLVGPNFSLYNNQEDINYVGSKTNTAFTRINILGNLTYQLDRNQQIFPRIHYSLQGPHGLLQIGASYRKSYYTFNQTAIHAGMSLRSVSTAKSLTPVELGFLVGFEIKKIIIGLHYDAGIRDLAKYNQLTNSFEISISIVGDYNNQSFICPEF